MSQLWLAPLPFYITQYTDSSNSVWQNWPGGDSAAESDVSFRLLLLLYALPFLSALFHLAVLQFVSIRFVVCFSRVARNRNLLFSKCQQQLCRSECFLSVFFFFLFPFTDFLGSKLKDLGKGFGIEGDPPALLLLLLATVCALLLPFPPDGFLLALFSRISVSISLDLEGCVLLFVCSCVCDLDCFPVSRLHCWPLLIFLNYLSVCLLVCCRGSSFPRVVALECFLLIFIFFGE